MKKYLFALSLILIDKPMLCTLDDSLVGSCSIKDSTGNTHSCTITPKTKITTGSLANVVVIDNDGNCSLIKFK